MKWKLLQFSNTVAKAAVQSMLPLKLVPLKSISRVSFELGLQLWIPFPVFKPLSVLGATFASEYL